MMPALKTWLRYLAPLTVLSAIALLPIAIIALRTRIPLDLAGASATVTLGWELLAFAVFGQLVLVGGASAIYDARPSQLRAFTGGLVCLIRAIVPCLASLAAILIGSLALVIPGPVLLVLLSLTGASRERGARARLLDSITVARRHLRMVAVVVAGMLLLDIAIVVLAQRGLVHLQKRPTPSQLAAVRDFVRVIAVALVIASPVPALLLASIERRVNQEPSP